MRHLLATTLAAALMSGTALAADLPRRIEPVPVAVPLFTWSGFYVGVNAGYAFSENDTIRTRGINAGGVNLQTNVNNFLRPPSVRLPSEGFAAGGQIGANYQFTPGSGVVIGGEIDAQYTDLQRTLTENRTNLAFNPNTLINTYRTELGYLGTVRARLGYAFDRVFVYGTGGFAYGDVTQSVTFQTGAPVTYAASRSLIRTGYAYGGGIEYALPTDSFLNVFRASAVTLKGEYLRYDLGRRDLFVRSTGGPGLGYISTFRTEGSLARAGVNYKF